MLAFTIPAQAITIEELTSQPQFKQVSQFVSDIPNVDERGASYIDVNTVKVIGLSIEVPFCADLLWKIL